MIKMNNKKSKIVRKHLLRNICFNIAKYGYCNVLYLCRRSHLNLKPGKPMIKNKQKKEERKKERNREIEK